MRLVAFVLLLAGCNRPPPAPTGLDDSSRFLLRNFYADDATVGAGLTGLMDWVDDEGRDLVGVEANSDNVNGFTLADLTDEDVAELALPDDGRAVADAGGVVGVATIACSPDEAEALLVRADQTAVFDGDFDAYDREFVSSRSAFEAATGDVPALDEPVDPLADGFDPEVTAANVLFTSNDVTVTALGTTVDYTLLRDFRHGTFDVQGEPVPALLALGYVPEPSTGSDGTTLQQNYGVEISLRRAGEDTFRVFAVWTRIDSSLIGPDSPIWATNAVNTTRKSAQRMSDLCTGDDTIPAEE
jgi:hypothetical protein